MNGILLINKPKDYTSHDIVAVIKRLTNEKVGHTGTLDPNATGVLPLLVGKATGLSKYLINHDKIYIATLKLGIKTDTADGEGNVIEKKEIPNINEEIIVYCASGHRSRQAKKILENYGYTNVYNLKNGLDGI